jgi:prolyl-tRNA editing enzyme YbaK/EbsC (Cys-tRNA(Pro) deacylase)
MPLPIVAARLQGTARGAAGRELRSPSAHDRRGSSLDYPQSITMIPEKVQKVLAAHGLAAIEFASGTTATSVLAAQQLGVKVGQIAKSLLFIGKDGRFFMVIAPGDRRISSSKLKAATGVKSRMASAEEALAATGFGPGGVCPFGIDAGIALFIDRGLASYDTIYPAAGTDSSGVPVTFDALVSITGGSVGDFLGNNAAEHG